MASVSVGVVLGAMSSGASISGGVALSAAAEVGAGALTAASVAGTAASAISSRESGIAVARDDRLKALQAGVDAGSKSITIRENLLKALSSQGAAAGVGGIGTGGPTSFGANVNRQINQNKNDLLGVSADLSMQQQQYGAQAGSATMTGNVAAGKSILDGGMSAAKSL